MTGIGSSISRIFQSVTGTTPAVDPAKTAPNGVVPDPATQPKSDGTVGAIPTTATGEASPLAGYEKLWETSKDDPVDPRLTPDLSYDPKKLLEGAKKVDFTKAINPAHMTKLQEGFDPAAMSSAIGEATQAALAYAQGSTLSIVQAALEKQEKKFHEEVLPAALKKHQASTSIAADNPIFENPAVSALLEPLKNQLVLKYPKASPEEITKHAKEYLSGMAAEIVKSSGGTISTAEAIAAAAKSSPQREETNWDDWIKS